MFKNILIIGFGMIGSSIAQTAIKNNKSLNIYAFDKSSTLKKRLKKYKLSKIIALNSLSEANKKI